MFDALGTHVAGVIGAVGDNDRGIVGGKLVTPCALGTLQSLAY